MNYGEYQLVDERERKPITSKIAPLGSREGALCWPEFCLGLVLIACLCVVVTTLLVSATSGRVMFTGVSVILYGAAAGFVLSRWRIHQQEASTFGWANRITFLRMILTIMLAVLVSMLASSELPLGMHSARVAHGILVAASVSLLLDGVDGWIARQTCTESAFGARFDMEVDAAFILVLCGLLWSLELAPGWVFAIGLMRYIFVAASRLSPALKAPLATSMRRKIICVIQILSLIVCLHPAIGRDAAEVILLAALLLLILSFAKDTQSLLK